MQILPVYANTSYKKLNTAVINQSPSFQARIEFTPEARATLIAGFTQQKAMPPDKAEKAAEELIEKSSDMFKKIMGSITDDVIPIEKEDVLEMLSSFKL